MSQARLSKVNRRANALVLSAWCSTMDSERIMFLTEMLRTRANGFTQKEREGLREQMEVIQEATREIRQINIAIRRSIGHK